MNTSCGCATTYGAEQTATRMVWLEGLYLGLAPSSTTYLEADRWLDCSDWMAIALQLLFSGSNGSYLTVTLQTAVAPSADNSDWADVTGCSGTMSTGLATWYAKASLAVPPASYLRLKFAVSASGAVSGNLRVVGVGKNAG